MNQRAQSPSPATSRRARACLTLLLPALTIEVALTTAPPALGDLYAYPLVPDEEMRPYLPMVGAPQLRFQEAIPPPDVSGRPPSAAPPSPEAKTKPEVVRSPVMTPTAAANAAVSPVAVKREASQGGSSTISVKSVALPPPILPDDAGRKVRPEDFLPYFSVPDSGATANEMTFIPPAPPAPGTLPPSTATYKQQ